MISCVQHRNTNVMISFLSSRFRPVAERQQRPDGSFHCGGISSLQVLTESVTHHYKHSYSSGKNLELPLYVCHNVHKYFKGGSFLCAIDFHCCPKLMKHSKSHVMTTNMSSVVYVVNPICSILQLNQGTKCVGIHH